MFQYTHFVYYRHSLYNSSINVGSISFFSSSDTTNPTLQAFILHSSFFKFNMPGQVVLTREKIKRNMLNKKAFLIVIKITVFLIVIKMTVFHN